MTKMSSALLVHQRLGFIGLSILLIFMTTIAPLSMDMFSPSIPEMTRDFNAPQSEVTLTVTIFFVFYAIGMLLFGTISDKFGRKPILLITMAAFIAGSALCALSPTLPMLIGSRVIQALGGGGTSAVAVALLKDVFAPEPREKFLMFMAVVQVIAPIVAPIIGAWVLTFSTWHMVFWILTGFGCVCFVGILLYNETLPKEQRLTTPIFSSYKRMGIMVKDRSFMIFMFATIMPNAVFGGFLAVGSYIYVDQFGCTETEFSYFFAATACVSIFGPLIYTALTKKFSKKTVITIFLVIPVSTVVLLAFFGYDSPFSFVIGFAPLSLAASAIRPAMTSILLLQHEDDAGSASGVINFGNTMGGALGMFTAALFAPDFIFGIIVLTGVFTLVSLLIWVGWSRSSLTLKGLDSTMH